MRIGMIIGLMGFVCVLFSSFTASGEKIVVGKNAPIIFNIIKDSENTTWDFMKSEIEEFFQKKGFVPEISYGKGTDTEELNITIGKIASSEIRPIYIRYFKGSDIENDGFFVKKIGNRIYIGAETERGLLNGIHDFMEKNLKVHWIRPRDSFQIKPSQSLKFSSCNYSSKPAFSMRGMGQCSYHGVDEALVRWMAFNKMNCSSLPVSKYEKRIDRIMRQGFIVGGGGHSFYFWLPFKYYKEHPEYYALINGERRWYSKFEKEKARKSKYAAKSAQLCMSNPEVVNVVADNIINFLRQHPEVEDIPLVMNDGAGWCECEKCKAMDTPEERKKGKYSTRYVTWVNQVARKVYEEFPDVKIAILAYYFALEPPKVKPFRNIVIGFCPLRRCYKHTLNDPSCRVNRYFNKQLKGWLKFGNPVYIYEYYLFGGAPEFEVPLLKVIKADLIYLKSVGVDGLKTEIIPDGYPASEKNIDLRPWYSFKPPKAFNYWTGMKINFYLLAKLLWDPHQDLKNLQNQYFMDYFGEAGKPLSEMYRWIETQWYNSNYCYVWNKWGTNFPTMIFTKDEDIEYCQKLLNKAEAEAKKQNNPLIIKRVKREKDLANNIWFAKYNLLARKKIPIYHFNGKTISISEIKRFAESKNSVVSGFVKKGRKGGEPLPVSKETKVYAAYNDKYLFICYECFDNDIKNLASSKKERDGNIWRDDTAEIFLQSGSLQKEYASYYQFASNPIGVLYDARVRDSKWNSNTKVITRINQNSWEVLFQIPLKDINYPPLKKGMKLPMNFGRNARKIKEVSSWTDGSFHSRSSFGKLIVR